jgi:hypothetical protein
MDDNLVCDQCSYDQYGNCQVCGLPMPIRRVMHPIIDALYNEYVESEISGEMPDRYCFNCGTSMFESCAVCGSPGETLIRANEILLNAEVYNSTCLSCYEEPCICVLEDIRQVLGGVDDYDFDYCSMPEMEDCTSIESSEYSTDSQSSSEVDGDEQKDDDIEDDPEPINGDTQEDDGETLDDLVQNEVSPMKMEDDEPEEVKTAETESIVDQLDFDVSVVGVDK